jgi:hypothetical protein
VWNIREVDVRFGLEGVDEPTEARAEDHADDRAIQAEALERRSGLVNARIEQVESHARVSS